MTHAEQVQAASEILKARCDPCSRAIAAWLDDEARHIVADTGSWPLHRLDNPDAFIEICYRHPLAVARAVLDEALISPVERS
jgi:hypothetical protein